MITGLIICYIIHSWKKSHQGVAKMKAKQNAWQKAEEDNELYVTKVNADGSWDIQHAKNDNH